MMKIKSAWTGKDIEVTIKTGRYGNDRLAVMLVCYEDGYPEPYGNLTVNLPEESVPEGYAFIDTNNIPNAEQFIKEYSLGKPTGWYGHSGFCTYPLYRFNEDRLNELEETA